MKQQISVAADTILKSEWGTLTRELPELPLSSRADPYFKHNCLLLRNLRYDVDERRVRLFVRRVADPISVALGAFESGRHIGKAFVAMESPAVAHQVMAELKGNLLLGRPVVMEFAHLENMEMAIHAKKDRDKNSKADSIG